MPAPSWEDLDAFLSTDDFAVEAIFIPSETGVPRAPVRVIFDEPYLNAETGEYDMASGEPRATCKESDIAGIRKNDACDIGGVRFLLDHDPYPDGTGMACVKLSRDFS